MQPQKKKKISIVEWAMNYRSIVIMAVAVLFAFGVYSLENMRKNEFPDFTIRQGMVVAVCPGSTAQEIEEQVVKPLEDYIFEYKEVKKSKTISKTRDGITYIQVELNDNLKNKDEFWSKFKHGVSTFKSQLPNNVLAVQVMDDFGDTSALLITMESNDKTFVELDGYMDELKSRLRRIESVGRLTVYGMQRKQISVELDNNKLSHYGISDKTLAMSLFTKGFSTASGRLKDDTKQMPIYVAKSLNTLRDVQEMIIYSDLSGNNIRLKDVANVKEEYPSPDSYILNNGRKCLMLSVEMKQGQNIVKLGEQINAQLDEFQQNLPQDVSLYKITDQSKVVGDSVNTFIKELLIAIVAVMIVVMLLLPMRVALVAASTIPISIFISLGLFSAFGMELNTVTLAALIITLGMIVDNSIVIIDSYVEMLAEGVERKKAALNSTEHFFKSILSATLAISVTFFPFLLTTKGMINDFLQSFPWAITIVLMVSLAIALLLVPFMMYKFIKTPVKEELPKDGKKKFSFLNALQQGYEYLLDKCFKHRIITVVVAIITIVAGVMGLGRIPQKLMPIADRNQFAVEIYLPTGSSLNETAKVADSLRNILSKDKKILSVASFVGSGSPRFQTAYAPQLPGSNYAQFIVNTTDNKATVELLNKYTPMYSNYFANAVVRFKQLEYSEATYPIEIRIGGEDRTQLKLIADSVVGILNRYNTLNQVKTDMDSPLAGTLVKLDEDESTRLGVTNMQLDMTLAMRYGSGIPLANLWEGDYKIPVYLKSDKSDTANINDVLNEQIPVVGGLSSVPLRQIAKTEAVWTDGQIVRRNGTPSITVMADMNRGENAPTAIKQIKEQLSKMQLPAGVNITYGGDDEFSSEQMPDIMSALMVAIGIIFLILVLHFRKISTAAFILGCLSLSLFGTAAGLMIMNVEFGVTCVLGIISLLGIIVRNGIIMLDYSNELLAEGMSVNEAIYMSAKRRMRPIFLTSAAASMGVIPMILGGSGLWMPMGTVIFFGTLITMVFILLVIPVAYSIIFGNTKKVQLKQD